MAHFIALPAKIRTKEKLWLSRMSRNWQNENEAAYLEGCDMANGDYIAEQQPALWRISEAIHANALEATERISTESQLLDFVLITDMA